MRRSTDSTFRDKPKISTFSEEILPVTRGLFLVLVILASISQSMKLVTASDPAAPSESENTIKMTGNQTKRECR
jgi:hypothetical protein